MFAALISVTIDNKNLTLLAQRRLKDGKKVYLIRNECYLKIHRITRKNDGTCVVLCGDQLFTYMPDEPIEFLVGAIVTEDQIKAALTIIGASFGKEQA